MPKTYNTPKRTFVVKTRLTEEEHSFFMEQLKNYEMSQSEFIRQAIDGAVIKPIIRVNPVNDEVLEMLGKLVAEYNKMQKATDLDDRRIYDRILEVCVPILFDGENFRKGNAAENLKKATRILNNENGRANVGTEMISSV